MVDAGNASGYLPKTFTLNALNLLNGSTLEIGVSGGSNQSDSIILLTGMIVDIDTILNVIAYSDWDDRQRVYVIAQGVVDNWKNFVYDTDNYLLTYSNTTERLLLSRLNLSGWEIMYWNDLGYQTNSLQPVYNDLATNGDTLYIRENIEFDEALSDTVNWTTLTMRGQDELGGAVLRTFNGQGNSGLSLLGKELTFSDLIFTNFSTSTNGGAIWASGSTITFGGEIQFINNTAGILGGAIYAVNNSSINFIAGGNILFSGNTAGVLANDIYLDNSKLYLNAGDYQITMDGGITANNGGEIYVTNGGNIGGWLLSGVSEFNGINRFEISQGSMSVINGNLTYINNVNLNLINSAVSFINSAASFANNTSATNGGAIYAEGSTISFVSGADTLFSGNKAGVLANDIYLNASKLYLDTKNYQITMEGGIIANKGSEIFLTNSGLGGAWVLLGAAEFGGVSSFNISQGLLSAISTSWTYVNNKDGINLSHSTISFIDSTASFASNSTEINGGAISLESSYVEFTNSSTSFINNSAASEGGAIYAVNGSSIRFTVDGSILFRGNTAGGLSNDIYLDSSSLYLDAKNYQIRMHGGVKAYDGSEISWVHNGGSWYLGGISEFNNMSLFYISAQSSISVVNASWTYINNNSSLDLLQSTISFINSRVSFLDNTNNTYEEGGAISLSYGFHSRANFISSIVDFINNKVVGGNDGGAIFIGDGSQIDFVNSSASFVGNNADSDGGAISLIASTLNFTNSTITFISNAANYRGGAIYAAYASQMNFTKTSLNFISNTSEDGGAIYFDTTLRLNLMNSNVSFAGNRAARYGGAIYLSGDSVLSFTNSAASFIGNDVTESGGSGGAIYLIGAQINFINSSASFVGNRAIENGGAIYAINNSSVGFTAGGNILFRENMANGLENDIYLDASKLYLDAGVYQIRMEGGIKAYAGSTISWTNASGGAWILGGINELKNMGLFNIGSQSSITVMNASWTYINNKANLNLTSSRISFMDDIVNFSTNSAAGNGGVISLNNRSTANFVNAQVNFTSNTSSQQGGGIYLNNYSQARFINSMVSFTSNAALSGGAISLVNSQLSFANSLISFIGNSANDLGGAIYAANNSSIELAASDDILFKGNTAGGAGNDIYLDRSRLYLSANDYQIKMEGGIKAYGGSTVSWTNGAGGSWLLEGNSEFNNMGLFQISDHSSITVMSANFTYANNKRELTLILSTMSFIDTLGNFTGNSAINGGGIYILGNSLVNFINSTMNFVSNTVNYYGGALYIGGTSQIDFENSSASFIGNRANYQGGAIYNARELTFKNTNVIFEGNVAGIAGNDIYNDNGGVINIIEQSEIKLRSGINGGGNINITNAVLRVSADGSTARDITVDAGTFSLVDAGNINGYWPKTFTVDVLSLINGGTLEIGIVGNSYASDLIKLLGTGAVMNVGVGSKLSIMTYVPVEQGERNYIIAQGLVSGWENFVYDNQHYLLSYSNNSLLLSIKDPSRGDIYYWHDDESPVHSLEQEYDDIAVDYDTLNIMDDIGFLNALTANPANWTTLKIRGWNGAAAFLRTFDGNSNPGFNLFGKDVAFSDLNFVEFSTATNGGVILAEQSTITFSGRVNFITNTAVGNDGIGGAIYLNYYSQANFINSSASFIDNTGGEAGAVYVNVNSTLSFTNSTASFIGNKATYQNGGAISLTNSQANFINSSASFINNQAAQNGGAIYAANGSRVSFEASGDILFSENTAGGAANDIYLDNSQLSLDAKSYQIIMEGGIKAINGSKISLTHSGSGGGWLLLGVSEFNGVNSFRVSQGSMSVIDTSFTYRHNQDSLRLASSTMNFINSTVSFASNIGTENGGAISLTNSQLEFTNSSMSFVNNQAAQNGGAIYAANGSSISFTAIADIMFIGNTANGLANDIYLDNSKLYLNARTYQVRMEGGIIANKGSEIYWTNESGGNWVLLGISEINGVNSFQVHQGSMTVMNGSWTYINNNANMKLTGSTISFINTIADFSTNTTINNGGGIYLGNYSQVSFMDSQVSFASNSAQLGGALYFADNTSQLNLINSTISFTGNSAAGSGGAIYLNNMSSVGFIGQSIDFENNAAQNAGGAIYLDVNTQVNFINSSVSFTGNRAGRGGALYFSNSTSQLNLINSTISFTGNSATGSGGAIYLNNTSSVGFADQTVNFIGNSAETNGGALYLDSNTKLNFTNSVVNFIGNSADRGGALYFSNDTSQLNLHNSSISFENNEARVNGGAIYAINNSSIGFTAVGDILFRGNKANGAPNDIYLVDSRLYLDAKGYKIIMDGGLRAYEDSEITWRNDEGGAWELGGESEINNIVSLKIAEGSSITVTNGRFVYTANRNNLHISGSTISFINAEGAFVRNSASNNASNNGGGIYLDRGSLLTSEAAAMSFVGNGAGNMGGGIYLESDSDMTIKDSEISFTSNTARYGGGLYVSGGARANFIGSSVSFIGNTATGNGGAIYGAEGSSIAFEAGGDIIFRGNKASGKANDIYLEGGSIYLNAGIHQIIMESGIRAYKGSTITWRNDSNSNNGNSGAMVRGMRGSGAMSGSLGIEAQESGWILGGVSEISDIALLEIEENSIISVVNGSFTYVNNKEGMKLERSTINFINSTASFIANKAGDAGMGGGIYLNNNSQINFIGSKISYINNEGELGGGIYLDDSSYAKFENTVGIFSGNVSVSSGGGMYVNTNSRMEFINSNISFTNNKAEIGGGIYNEGRLTFRGSRVIVEGNEGREGRGIYNDERGEINIADGSEVIIRDGMIDKGSINIDNKGILRVSADGSELGTVKITRGGMLSTVDTGDGNKGVNYTTKTVNVTGLELQGILEVGIVLNTNINDLINVEGSIDIMNGSILSIRYFGYWKDVREYTVLEGTVNNWEGLSYDNRYYSVNYDYGNNKLLLFVHSDPTPKAIDVSAIFIANALMNAGTDVNADGIYNNIKDVGLGVNVWGEVNGGVTKGDNGNAMGTFDVGGENVYAGMDVIVLENSKLGIYVGGINKTFGQGDNRGSMDGFEGGMYGGIFGDRLTLKAKAGVEIDNIKTQREVKGEYVTEKMEGSVEATTIKGGAEIEYEPIKISKNKSFKIFARADTSLTSSGEMREKYREGESLAMTVEGKSDYIRLTTRIGGKYTFNMGGLTIGVKGYMGMMPIGNAATYKMSLDEKFDVSKEVDGGKLAETFFGAGINGEYKISDGVSLTANLNGSNGTDEYGYNVGGGLGLNVKFGGKKEVRKRAGNNRNNNNRNNNKRSSNNERVVEKVVETATIKEKVTITEEIIPVKEEIVQVGLEDRAVISGILENREEGIGEWKFRVRGNMLEISKGFAKKFGIKEGGRIYIVEYSGRKFLFNGREKALTFVRELRVRGGKINGLAIRAIRVRGGAISASELRMKDKSQPLIMEYRNEYAEAITTREKAKRKSRSSKNSNNGNSNNNNNVKSYRVKIVPDAANSN
ncbi:MAG: hypothetical protein LBQ37_02120 [Elusimicrobiota bacterium]|nr:hypothetical protein [Elusimicrobiota bacterium]